MNKILVKYEGNWVDEFDVKGYEIVTEEFFDEMINYSEQFFNDNFNGGNELEIYFGTNEAFMFDSHKDVLDFFTKTNLSFFTIDFIETIFGDNMGVGNMVSSTHEQLYEILFE